MTYNASEHQRGKDKLSKIPVKVISQTAQQKKPDWIKIKLKNNKAVSALKEKISKANLNTVCQEANCPNLYECYNHKTASFMIMGNKCTRRCSFCDVAHGRPDPLDPKEPDNLANIIKDLGLKYVVITSVDRDDLRDGGALHFTQCIKAIRALSPATKIEILVPDFRGRMEKALSILKTEPADVFNHNIETAPSLYKQARPGSDYQWSLDLLNEHYKMFPDIPTKSGMMLGLGETDAEIVQVMQDLRAHNVSMLTLGQYLQPSNYHMPVDRFVTPVQFENFKKIALELGFEHVASGPLVRSSYHADLQAAGEEVS